MEGLGGSSTGVTDSMFANKGPKVQAAAPKKVSISAGVMVGMLHSEDSAGLSADRQGCPRLRDGGASGDNFEDRTD